MGITEAILIGPVLGGVLALGEIMKLADALALFIERVTPENEREWMVAALYSSTLLIICALIAYPELGKMELFKVLAQAIVLQGFLQLAAAFYFTSSKEERGEVRKNLDDKGET